MSILSGWIKTRRRKKTEDGYKAVSYDTSAETVYYNNGLTLEESNVYLTQAEYDALGDEKLTNNVTYHITDSGVGKDVSAKYINYDNTNSELSSENVQNALDEISTNVATNETNIEANTTAITELNNALSNKIEITYKSELLTCQAKTWREYIFPNLPEHVFSIPFIDQTTYNPEGCFVIRDLSTSGKVKVYSPIQQNVGVTLVVFK